MSLDEAMEQFGKALGNLKRAYAEENDCNPNTIDIFISADNNVTLILYSSDRYIQCYHDWVNTEEE